MTEAQTGRAESSLDVASLLRPDVVGPRIAEATGDDAWTDFSADLIAGGKSNLTFVVSSG
ncbi:MAG TPA: phosphotransferase family protein, partial [Intrasporangiaceae bacterium]|nr:phosphotransferase family protein [Intrasporangiaceae bacterium]